MYEYKQKLDTIRVEIENALQAVDIPHLKIRSVELTLLTQNESFWKDQEQAQKINKELSDLKKEIERWEKIQKDCQELSDFLPSLQNEEDPATLKDFKQMVDLLQADWDKLEISTFLNGRYDKNNAILNIHAGTGGKDAQDFAEMLMRMYIRYAERQGFEVEVAEKSLGEEVGLKSATIFIKGYLAYGYLKVENGVHRLVRQSPFNAKNSRETSFVKIEVLPEIPEENLPEIRKEDLRIDTYRSSGAGGQNVNKTSSAVRITHLPTNIVVACQDERSQLHNKDRAMKVLQAKLVDLMEKQQVQEINEIRGERVETSWGNQIRSYVLHPYTMVKDHRTNHEEHNVNVILDGEIDGFIEAMLKAAKK